MKIIENMRNTMQLPIIFFTIGDWGSHTPDGLQTLLKTGKAMSKYCETELVPDYILTLGDNFYEKGVYSTYDEKWSSHWYNVFIAPYKHMHHIPWKVTLGNHDYYGGYDSVDSQIEMSRINKIWCLPNNHYYYIDKISNSYFIHIDTCKIYPELYTETSLMINKHEIKRSLVWLENTLIEAQKNKANWIFVIGHYHIFSNGFYKNYEFMEIRLLPLLIRYNVNVYFCGHEHNFQILQYQNLHCIINGAGSFKSNVFPKNINKNVKTHYTSNSNGFTIHKFIACDKDEDNDTQDSNITSMVKSPSSQHTDNDNSYKYNIFRTYFVDNDGEIETIFDIKLTK